VKLVVVLDCRDPVAPAGFWAPALGYRQASLAEPYLSLVPEGGGGPEILLQRVPEPKSAKNHMHLDLRVDQLEEERERLLALGAKQLSDLLLEDGFRWYVTADPEGNEFCVIKEPSSEENFGAAETY
jgi:predicted enzyme related to lactoylglutathione lyase